MVIRERKETALGFVVVVVLFFLKKNLYYKRVVNEKRHLSLTILMYIMLSQVP